MRGPGSCLSWSLTWSAAAAAISAGKTGEEIEGRGVRDIILCNW